MEAHRAAGHTFTAASVQSFVRREGAGEPVVLMHGVPSSSFLYRKVLPALAQRGLEGVAFDLPGLGLAARPVDFDYSWTGLGRFSIAAMDALGLERFHLVVHDIGGPVGFEVAAALRERVRSLTVLNTLIDVDRFRRPWSMHPFSMGGGIDRLWLSTVRGAMFRMLMRMQGIADASAMSAAEMDAYVSLLKREDGGAAFLKIMKGFELTQAKRALYRSTLGDVPYPVQVVWGEDDPALSVEHFGEIARAAAGVDAVHRLPGKHFFQEEQPHAIAEHVARLARSA
ncbi:MAG: alpha/beta fold hydrolase [Myxococcota bacterium]